MIVGMGKAFDVLQLIRGLVTPHGAINQSQHYLKQWFAAWRHQAITWTNVD